MSAVAVPPGRSRVRRGWSLERRVNRSIAAVLVLLMLLIVVVVSALLDARDKGDEVIERWDPALLARQTALAAMINQETGVRGFAVAREQEFLEPYEFGKEPAARAEADLERYLQGEKRLLELLAAYTASVDNWRQSVADPFIDRVLAGDPTVDADAVSPETKAAFDRIRAASSDLEVGIRAEAEEAQGARNRAFVYVWLAVAAGIGVILLVGLLLARGLRRQVLAPIRGLMVQARSVAGGALDRTILQPGPTEIEGLAADIDSMRASLASQIARIERDRLRLVERSAELARSNDDLEQFAYVASHDLSEPLRKVTNFCQLLERQYADQLDDKGRQYIAFMVDGAKRMQALITDLLSFSRVGRTTADFVQVDLGDALARALSNLDEQVRASGARVTHASLPSVPGDPTLLTALLQNLVGNALKYHSDERRPTVEITAEPHVENGVEVWLVTVSDNGIGIDRQYAERIFTIFQRLHLRDAYGGTGIGLALCRKIVDFHKGRIWLAEKPDPGAKFEFTLPVHQAPLETADDEPAQHAHA